MQTLTLVIYATATLAKTHFPTLQLAEITESHDEEQFSKKNSW